MSVVAVIVIAAVLVGLYAWYASIVTRRNRVAEALAGIDVQLTQRHDLIPNVLAIAKRYMTHETDLLEDIARLRSAGAQLVGQTDPAAVGEKFKAEAQLSLGMGRLFAVSESYPEMRSSTLMVEAQRTYQEVETNIAAARRFYNSAVTQLRNSCQVFPGSLLAGLAGAGTLPPFFEAEAASRAPVSAADHL